MNTAIDPLIGTRLDGRYRIERVVGTGGMAKVYLATDETLGRQVAIKLLGSRYAHDNAFVERFMREASAAAKLNHPNIVQVYDRGEAADSYYIVMEYVDGTTLKDVIRSRGALPEQEAIHYGEQALNALRFAHRNGIVHRDVKPHNMMVDGEGRLKIADFGIARAGSDAGLTEVGSIVGTAQYLSPEQARGLTVSASSDLYSLGVVLFEMSTGRVPYDGESPVNVALRHVNDPIPSPRSFNPAVSRSLEAIVVRSMQKDPAARYATADEMLADLHGVSTGHVSEQTTSVLVGAAAGAAPTTIQPAVQPVLPAIPMDASSSYAEASAYSPHDATPEDEPKRSRAWLWIVLLLLVLAGGAAAFLLTGTSDTKSQQIDVPSVIGMKQQDAETKIEDAGLRVGKVTFATDKDAAKGDVLEQGPEAGTQVDENAKIDLVVSSGPELTSMPRVVGKSEADARQALRDAGLTRITVTKEFSDTVAAGKVLSQTPPEGTEVAPDTDIALVISDGAESTTVPNVQGDDFTSAQSDLQKVGFDVSKQEADSDQPKGTVLSQSVPAGQKAKTGSTIVLTIATGFNTVPNTVGKTPEDAQSALQDAGFVPQVGTDTEDPTMTPGDPDIVSSQSPSNGRRQIGGTITINVKHAPAGP